MKIRNLFISVVFFLALLKYTTSCRKETDHNFKYLKLIDSIIVPENIIDNNPFDIECYGTVGVDGCHHFSHFKTTN